MQSRRLVKFFLTKGDHTGKGYRPKKVFITDITRIKYISEHIQGGEVTKLCLLFGSTQ